MKLAVIGTGYVGLVTGVCFASMGHEVTCIDKDVTKIAILQQGGATIYEEGLPELLGDCSRQGRLHFTSDITAITAVDAVFLAVGTPPNEAQDGVDLSFLYSALDAIIACYPHDSLILVIKSTVPVGTAARVRAYMKAKAPHCALTLLSNPEFLREGRAIDDFITPDRVVVGVHNDAGRTVAAQLYEAHTARDIPLLITSNESAELIKYASNALLATKIAFINEIADICEASGASIDDVAQGVGLDHRIGSAYLQAGPGFGGSCFPKDTIGLVSIAAHYQVDTAIIPAVIHANNHRKLALASRIVGYCGGDLRGKTIALLGLTFKAGTDDMRDSPSVPIAMALHEAGATLRCYDPQGMRNAAPLLPLSQLTYATSMTEALQGAHGFVIATEWPEFAALSPALASSQMQGRIAIDCRHMIAREAFTKAGFMVYTIGHPSPNMR